MYSRLCWCFILVSLICKIRCQFPHHHEQHHSTCALMMPSYSHQTCITYEDVNTAFMDARDKFGIPPPSKEKFSIMDVGHLGTVIHETSRNLAKQYSLSKDAIAKGLSMIDTTQSAIKPYCPPFLMAPACSVKRYRSVEGICNNMENPHWGAAMNGHHRFLSPDYADGVSAPRVSASGFPLPNPRKVSTTIHKDDGFHDHAVTIMMVAWGQFMDHDITLTAETRDPKTGKTPECCDVGLEGSHADCLPIDIPHDDHFFSLHKRSCMNFARVVPGLRFNCKLGPREQFNTISSIIDANTVYSSDPELQDALRAHEGGLLKTMPIFSEYGLKEMLPLKIEEPDDGCIRPSEDVYCFLAGDPRVNEQTVLAIVHLFMVREHNRIATELGNINHHWDDETLFQETRHIIAAIIQHITYNEFLPMLLGKDVMFQHGLESQTEGYFDGYKSGTNPSATNSFVSQAFRFGHSLLPSSVERWSKSHRYIGSQRLSEMLQQPYDLYKAGWADNYMMGLVNQVAQALDDAVTQEVTNHLFEEPGKKFGMDLAAINMQRGREHGIPGYGKWRDWCGLASVKSFDDMHGIMPNDSIRGYSELYDSPEDIDLWSAGITEIPLPGAMLGPTFACIMGRSFHNLKHGDRFWYENGGWPSSFTSDQLDEIRKVKLSRILCDNSDHLETVQVYSMVLPDHKINPRVSCKSSVLHRMDLTKWSDHTFDLTP